MPRDEINAGKELDMEIEVYLVVLVLVYTCAIAVWIGVPRLLDHALAWWMRRQERRNEAMKSKR